MKQFADIFSSRALSSSAGVDENSVWVPQAFTSVASLFLCVDYKCIFKYLCFNRAFV